MVDLPLSKRGWMSVVVTILLLPIMGGFLSAFGEDIYQVSRSMVVDSQVQYIILPIIILIGIGIVIGVVLIITDIYRQKTKRLQHLDREQRSPSIDDFEIEGETTKTTNDEPKPESKRHKENKWKFFPSNST